MPWANFDDAFPEHPKVDGLSDGAFRLHVAGICYCNRLLTDGLVPVERIPRLMPRYRPRYLEELVDRALWLPVGDAAYTLHDFLEWNRSREQVEGERERKRKGGRKGAHRRWDKP